MQFSIRKATREDADVILHFIRQLSEYEKLADSVSATRELILKFGFGERPCFEALLAENDDGEPLGMALYFYTFSTFLSRPTLYLEDLFVSPQSRANGVGKALLRELVEIARQRGCGRVEWAVLDWNEPAIRFYESLGANPVSGWTIYRLDGKNLAAFDI